MWGTPRESQTFTRESRAKALRKECVKVEPRKQWRKQVDSRSTFHHLRAIFRESNRERYYEIHVAAKARTVRAKEPRKPLRKLVRIRTKSLPRFSTPLNYIIYIYIMCIYIYTYIYIYTLVVPWLKSHFRSDFWLNSVDMLICFDIF